MFLDMDYCQLSILLNTTVMNILKHKAFSTGVLCVCVCVCVCVLGRERKLGNLCHCLWGHILVTVLVLGFNRDHLEFTKKLYFSFRGKKSNRKQERSTTSELACWIFLAALRRVSALYCKCDTAWKPTEYHLALFECSGVSCGAMTCAHEALLTQKLPVIIFLGQVLFSLITSNLLISLIHWNCLSVAIGKIGIHPQIKEVLPLRISCKVYNYFFTKFVRKGFEEWQDY